MGAGAARGSFPTAPDGGSGGVSSLGVTAPIVNTGTATDPVIGITPATTMAPGSLSAADKTKLDALPSALTLPVSETNGGFGANVSAIGTGFLRRAGATLYSAAAIVVSEIASALAAGGNPITGTILTASVRVETPTIGTSSATQHAPPSGTTPLLSEDSTAVVSNKSISGSANTLTNIPNSALTNSSVTVSAGTGLTGGGAAALGGSTSLSMPNTGTAGTYAYPSSVTTDTQGRVSSITAGSAPPVAVTAASVTATYTPITTDLTWTDVIGLSFSLANGTYILDAELVIFVACSIPEGAIQARLFNSTDAAVVPDSLRTCVSASVPSANYSCTAPVSAIVVITGGPKTIKVQVQRFDGATYDTSEVESDSGLGFSTFRYIKIA